MREAITRLRQGSKAAVTCTRADHGHHSSEHLAHHAWGWMGVLGLSTRQEHMMGDACPSTRCTQRAAAAAAANAVAHLGLPTGRGGYCGFFAWLPPEPLPLRPTEWNIFLAGCLPAWCITTVPQLGHARPRTCTASHTKAPTRPSAAIPPRVQTAGGRSVCCVRHPKRGMPPGNTAQAPPPSEHLHLPSTPATPPPPVREPHCADAPVSSEAYTALSCAFGHPCQGRRHSRSPCARRPSSHRHHITRVKTHIQHVLGSSCRGRGPCRAKHTRPHAPSTPLPPSFQPLISRAGLCP